MSYLSADDNQKQSISLKKAHDDFRECCAAWQKAIDSDEQVPAEIIRATFVHLIMVLRIYCLPQNWNSLGKPREHLPLTLVYLLANKLQYIEAGELPAEIALLTSRGRPSAGPHEQRDIGLAVATMKLAERGLLDIKAPTKHIAKVYGIDERTARRWKSQFSWVEPEHFFPATDDKSRPELIKDEADRAGHRYRKAGRSHVAQASRAKKRSGT